MALAYVGLGQIDEAFAALDQAWLDRDPAFACIDADPRYQPLKSDPRYQELLARVNLRLLSRAQSA
jgi:hypothetical protein